MNKSEQINELAKALCDAQKEILLAKKDATNPFFKKNYADLGSVWDACREPLTKNGLSVAQLGNGKSLETVLMHSSGQWISGSIDIVLDKMTPQEQGSAITYLRRYGLAAIAGVVQTDDDGEAAMKRSAAQAPSHEVKKEIAQEIEGSMSLAALKAAWDKRFPLIERMTQADQDYLVNLKDQMKGRLK